MKSRKQKSTKRTKNYVVIDQEVLTTTSVRWGLSSPALFPDVNILEMMLMLDTVRGTPCSQVLLQKPIISQKTKKLPAFYRSKSFSTVFTKARQWTLISQTNPVISSPSRYPVWLPSFSFLNKNLEFISHPFLEFPTHLIFLNLIYYLL
jgi:hypothetical protein